MGYKLTKKVKEAIEKVKRNNYYTQFPENREFYIGFSDTYYLEEDELIDFKKTKWRTFNDLTVGLVVDTEFWSKPNLTYGKPEMIDGYKLYYKRGMRQAITSQVKGVYRDKGLIFVSPDFATNKHIVIRHPIASSGFHPVDYLKQRGYEIELSRIEPGEDKPEGRINFILYAHFALAEYLMIADGSYLADFQEFVPNLYLKSRLTVGRPYLGEKDYITLPWKVNFYGKYYQVCVTIIDTGAMHGVASYKNTSIACGTNVDDKDLLNDHKLKMNMHKAYSEKQDEFDRYSLGDLNCFENLIKNAKNFEKIYEALGLTPFYKKPELTIGATTKDLFVAIVGKSFGLKGRKDILITSKLNAFKPSLIPQNGNKKFSTDYTFEELENFKYIEPIGNESQYTDAYEKYILGEYDELMEFNQEVLDILTNNLIYESHKRYKLYKIFEDNNEDFTEKGNVLNNILKTFISESNAKELKFYAKDKR